MFSVQNPATSADRVSFDNTGTAIAGGDTQAALVELDGRSIFLRQKTLNADFTVDVGYFAVFLQPRIPNNVRLRINETGTLRVLG